MVTRNASRLDAGLIARKGEAVPASPTPLAPSRDQPSRGDAVPVGRASAPPPVNEAQQEERTKGGTIAVTVKLDPGRYERLRMHGARTRRTNQAILQEALDSFLARHTD